MLNPRSLVTGSRIAAIAQKIKAGTMTFKFRAINQPLNPKMVRKSTTRRDTRFILNPIIGLHLRIDLSI